MTINDVGDFAGAGDEVSGFSVCILQIGIDFVFDLDIVIFSELRSRADLARHRDSRCFAQSRAA